MTSHTANFSIRRDTMVAKMAMGVEPNDEDWYMLYHWAEYDYQSE
jgi:hypothetical protein